MTDAELLVASFAERVAFVGNVVDRLHVLQAKQNALEMTKRQARRLARPLVRRAGTVLSFAEDAPEFDELDAAGRDTIDDAWAALAGWS